MLENRNKWEVLANAWRKAAETNDYTLVLPSHAEAKALRARLYACIRRAKAKKTLDQALVEIAECYSITIREEKLIIYRQALSHGLQALEHTLFKDDVAGSEGKLKELLGGEVAESSVAAGNPYFTRED